MNGRINGFACMAAACLILLVPLNWLLAGAAAAAIHELCHLISVWLLGGRVLCFRILPGGAVMEAADLSPWKSVASILAGPLGGFLFAWGICPFYPRTALCAVMQSSYNLLPVYPLDGGRLFRLLMGRKQGAGMAGLEGPLLFLTVLGLLVLAYWLDFPGILLLLLPLFREKYLAKQGKKGYNRATTKTR